MQKQIIGQQSHSISPLDYVTLLIPEISVRLDLSLGLRQRNLDQRIEEINSEKEANILPLLSMMKYP